MPSGLQLFNPNRDGSFILNITTRFTNLLGYIDLPIYYWWSYQGDHSYKDFTWKSIVVPEFGEYGEPFWCAFNMARQRAIETPVPSGWPSNWSWVDLITDRCLSDYSPECYASGNILYYRYPPDIAWAPGDYAAWAWGGHRLFYGVC